MKRPCNYPGCAALLDKSGYCERHKASAPKRHQLYNKHVRQRNSALAMAARIRNSTQWRNVRRHSLASSPLCADPHGNHARMGVTRTATQVHHIEGLATHPHLAFVASNLLCVCSGCHAIIEAAARSSIKILPATQHEPSSGDCGAFG